MLFTSFPQWVTSLSPQEVVCRSQISSGRAKLKLIFDQARDLIINCFEGCMASNCVPFKTARLHHIQDLE